MCARVFLLISLFLFNLTEFSVMSSRTSWFATRLVFFVWGFWEKKQIERQRQRQRQRYRRQRKERKKEREERENVCVCMWLASTGYTCVALERERGSKRRCVKRHGFQLETKFIGEKQRRTPSTHERRGHAQIMCKLQRLSTLSAHTLCTGRVRLSGVGKCR